MCSRDSIAFALLAACVALTTTCVAPAAAWALDHVSLRRDGQETRLEGRVVVQAQDDGLLFETRDGMMWAIQPDEIAGRDSDSEPFVPFDRDQLTAKLMGELPAGFQVHDTAHYLICYNTSRAYAEWCGALFERLHLAFTNFWSRKGFELHEPEFPQVALVFADRGSYAAYARGELGGLAESIIGYYSMRTNRITMYDLTGVQALRSRNSRRGSAAEINRMLAQPEARRLVATVIHEATHQVAFNTGLQTRYADIPLWVSEGIAVYFETPDLSNSRGWRTIGEVNSIRLHAFREYARQRPAGSLRSLIATDDRMRDTRQSNAAYAESWALNYFLIKQRSDEYMAYLRNMAKKRPFIYDGPERRVQEFEAAFGVDVETLDAEFMRQIGRLR